MERKQLVGFLIITSIVLVFGIYTWNQIDYSNFDPDIVVMLPYNSYGEYVIIEGQETNVSYPAPKNGGQLQVRVFYFSDFFEINTKYLTLDYVRFPANVVIWKHGSIRDGSALIMTQKMALNRYRER